MATFPGIDLLGSFSQFFTFLLVFAIVYGVLEVTNIFKDKGKTLNPLIAVSIGIMMLFSQRVINVMNNIAPWFVLIILTLVMLFIIFGFLGVPLGADSMKGFFENHNQGKTIIYFFIILVLLMVVYSISVEYGQDFLEGTVGTNTSVSGSVRNGTLAGGDTATGDFGQNFGATIFHPKVLGLISILVIASFSIRLISNNDS